MYTPFNGTINEISLRDFLDKLDYNLTEPEDRVALVSRILEEQGEFFSEYFEYFYNPHLKLTSPLSENNAVCKVLDSIGNYIIFAKDKEEKAKQRKAKKIITISRKRTMDKRETSFEGILSKLEGNEDAFYNFVRNDKNIIFRPKISITSHDLETIPELRELREGIEALDAKVKAGHFKGKDVYKVKKIIIESRQQQYIIKTGITRPIMFTKLGRPESYIQFDEDTGYYVGKEPVRGMFYDGENDDREFKLVSENRIDFANPHHIQCLLHFYSKLREATWDNLNSDMKYILDSLDAIVDMALEQDFPYLYDLVIWRIDGCTNAQIQEMLQLKHGIKHSQEYISSLFNHKIPSLIAEKYLESWLVWFNGIHKIIPTKKCNRCGQQKIASNRYFSKNTGTKDGLYSICKKCRSKTGQKSRK